jgi:Resolvase, N terminal domain
MNLGNTLSLARWDRGRSLDCSLCERNGQTDLVNVKRLYLIVFCQFWTRFRTHFDGHVLAARLWLISSLHEKWPRTIIQVKIGDAIKQSAGRNQFATDTTTASGELVFNLFSALAQFEQRLIQERTRAGLTAARARGRRKGGRKPLRSIYSSL